MARSTQAWLLVVCLGAAVLSCNAGSMPMTNSSSGSMPMTNPPTDPLACAFQEFNNPNRCWSCTYQEFVCNSNSTSRKLMSTSSSMASTPSKIAVVTLDLSSCDFSALCCVNNTCTALGTAFFPNTSDVSAFVTEVPPIVTPMYPSGRRALLQRRRNQNSMTVGGTQNGHSHPPPGFTFNFGRRLMSSDDDMMSTPTAVELTCPAVFTPAYPPAYPYTDPRCCLAGKICVFDVQYDDPNVCVRLPTVNVA